MRASKGVPVRRVAAPETAVRKREAACPTVSRDMIRVVLREMQAERKVEKIGVGRGARWKRIR